MTKTDQRRRITSWSRSAQAHAVLESLEGRALLSATALTGTAFGTAGSWNNSGNTYAKAVDANPSTFFDAPTANGDYVGLDLGSPQTIGAIKFAPRSGFAGRMVGGAFQGSNTSPTAGFVNLYTVASTPAQGAYTTVSVADTTAYRYVRYLAPSGSYGNIAEMEFDAPDAPVAAGAPNQLTGTAFGTPGSWGNAGNTFDKAFDGSASTFFDAPAANGNFAGLDLGSPQSLASVTFTPRSGFAYRMVGGKFQGSNTSSTAGFTDLYTITAQPQDGAATTVNLTAPGAYRYVRYLSPNGGYGNVAELAFFSAPATAPTATLPAAPSNLVVRDTDHAEVDLTWTDNANNETGYMVERSTSSDFSTFDRFFLPGNSTSFADTSALNGFTSYYYRVTATNGAGRSPFSNVDVGTTTDLPFTFTVDNTDPGVLVNGNWTAQTSEPGYVGANYLSDGGDGTDYSYVIFSPSLPHGGEYAVQVWYPSDPANASNASVEVFDSNGSRITTLDERTGGGQWVTVGSLDANLGSSYGVGFYGGGDGAVVADAVRFIHQPFVETDDVGTNLATAEGPGWQSATDPHAIGGSYFALAPSASTGPNDIYDAGVPWAGQWELYVHYITRPDGATNANIDGVTLNQRGASGGAWADLGTVYSFTGSESKDLNIAAGADGVVTIDAVRWVLTGPQ